MNIQINCKDNVNKRDLMYIYYNLKDWIKEYEENKDDYNYKEYINGKLRYYKKKNGNWSMTANMELICNGKTMFIKIK